MYAVIKQLPRRERRDLVTHHADEQTYDVMWSATILVAFFGRQGGGAPGVKRCRLSESWQLCVLFPLETEFSRKNSVSSCLSGAPPSWWLFSADRVAARRVRKVANFRKVGNFVSR
jgi:hypothetical protein